jgi:hypothetical protein
MDGENDVHIWPSADSYQGVLFMNNRRPGELYLTGGNKPPAQGPVPAGPCVAKVDDTTGKEIWRTYLQSGNVTGEWVGAANLNILPDGNIPIAFGNHLVKLDGDIAAHRNPGERAAQRQQPKRAIKRGSFRSGPNPLPPNLMTPGERRAEVCAIFARGLVRLRQSSELSDVGGDGVFGLFGATAASVTERGLSSKLKRVARSARQQRDGGMS